MAQKVKRHLIYSTHTQYIQGFKGRWEDITVSVVMEEEEMDAEKKGYNLLSSVFEWQAGVLFYRDWRR